MSKRNAPPATANRKKSKTAGTGQPKSDDAEEALAFNQWRVVLTGEFRVQPRTTLEQSLKSKGVAVTGSVSGKTTHLILGENGVNEYGRKTGVGSSKHNQAVERGLTIISEQQVWSLLTGTVSANELAQKKAASNVKATKSSPLPHKVLFVLQECGTKLSLPKLKKELEERFQMDFSNTRTKTSLKKALDTLIAESKLDKSGASYILPSVVPDVDIGQVEVSAQVQENVRQANIKKLCPENGRWRGLRVVSTAKSKSGRATCKACEQTIAKGQTQLQVVDDSLFKMIVFPGDGHEGVSRGYTEEDFGLGYTVSRQKFYIHDACQDAANAKFKAVFDREWKKIRPQVLEGRFPE